MLFFIGNVSRYKKMRFCNFERNSNSREGEIDKTKTTNLTLFQFLPSLAAPCTRSS